MTEQHSAIAFHWERLVVENPDMPLDRMIDEIADLAQCDVADVAEYMEKRLEEIETRPRRKVRA